MASSYSGQNQPTVCFECWAKSVHITIWVKQNKNTLKWDLKYYRSGILLILMVLPIINCISSTLKMWTPFLFYRFIWEEGTTEYSCFCHQWPWWHHRDSVSVLLMEGSLFPAQPTQRQVPQLISLQQSCHEKHEGQPVSCLLWQVG